MPSKRLTQTQKKFWGKENNGKPVKESEAFSIIITM